tara:strand:+ start:814 stop:1206 length:393 start_codon:yes stop_codon:yes gene_type:complete
MEENSNFEKLMDEELKNRFNHPWIRLDRGSKLNRIILFVKNEKVDKSLDDKQENKLKELLIRILDSNGLNKSSEIDYCSNEAKIISIKELVYNSDTKTYSYILKKKKKTEVSKSKSNIDRHFNKSKDKKK